MRPENEGQPISERFAGQVVLVTGGAGTLGAETAARFVREGARVASLDLQSDVPDGVLAIEGDVAQSSEVDAAVAATERELGPIGILVTAAGVPGRVRPIPELDDAEWERLMSIHAAGVFYANRAVVAGMVDRGFGRIINVGSIAGLEGNPNLPAYAASKAAVLAWTKSIGRKLATTGVIVNAVAPGIIDTPVLHGPDANEDALAYARSRVPMERWGTAEEVAALICWLASYECSFSTGAIYDISGGRAVY